jgi:hypothetical protein
MPRAARRCNRPGCDELTPCPIHKPKPWSDSRRKMLPGNWSSSIVPAILTRDPICQLAYPGTWHTRSGPAQCTVRSTEVDHIGAPDDHRLEMLRGVCAACHRRRTHEQSAAARRRPSS